MLLVLSQSYFFINLNLFDKPKATQVKTNKVIKINPVRAPNFNINKTTLEVDKHLKYYLNQLESQPTHRDLLINTALLYQQQDNYAEAEKYYYQAFSLDPNSFLFQIN